MSMPSLTMVCAVLGLMPVRMTLVPSISAAATVFRIWRATLVSMTGTPVTSIRVTDSRTSRARRTLFGSGPPAGAAASAADVNESSNVIAI